HPHGSSGIPPVGNHIAVSYAHERQPCRHNAHRSSVPSTTSAGERGPAGSARRQDPGQGGSHSHGGRGGHGGVMIARCLPVLLIAGVVGATPPPAPGSLASPRGGRRGLAWWCAAWG